MREESHLDDMRAAIRGDFERLEERRGEQELMKVSEPDAEEPEPEIEPEPPPSEPEPVEAPLQQTVASEAPVPEEEPEPDTEPTPAPDEPTLQQTVASEEVPDEAPRRSWLDKLLGR